MEDLLNFTLDFQYIVLELPPMSWYSLFFSLCVHLHIGVEFYTQMFFFGSWHATEPFAENLLSLDCPLFLDLFHVFSDFGCLFFYADDMDFPQPDSKAGEKCWFIVSLQGWGFLYW